MPKYKEMTAVEIAEETGVGLAKTLTTMYGVLVKEKLDANLIGRILERVSGAAHSNGDGKCRSLAEPIETISRPR